MNTATNHLVSGEFMEYKSPDYEAIPEELKPAAKKALNGRSEVYISRTSGGKLSKYAASKRKALRKAQAKSRKNNR